MNERLNTVGLEARGGRADSAPTLDRLEPHTDEWKYKRVKFHGMIQILRIPSVGRGRPVIKKMRDTKWVVDSEYDNENATAVRQAEAQGEINQTSRVKTKSAPRCESERCAVGSPIADISKSKQEKGQIRLSRR